MQKWYPCGLKTVINQCLSLYYPIIVYALNNNNNTHYYVVQLSRSVSKNQSVLYNKYVPHIELVYPINVTPERQVV